MQVHANLWFVDFYFFRYYTKSFKCYIKAVFHFLKTRKINMSKNLNVLVPSITILLTQNFSNICGIHTYDSIICLTLGITLAHHMYQNNNTNIEMELLKFSLYSFIKWLLESTCSSNILWDKLSMKSIIINYKIKNGDNK